MAYLVLYRDAAFTQIFFAFPALHMTYSSHSGGNPRTFSHGGKTYRYFDGSNYRFYDAHIQNAAATFDNRRNRVPHPTNMYFKNGLRVELLESTDTDDSGGGLRFWSIGGQQITSGSAQSTGATSYTCSSCVEFEYAGVKYIGFSEWTYNNTWNTWFTPICCVEESFWQDAIRPSYGYGEGTDEDGGQGEGAIPHTNIPLSSTPQRVVPFGGHGLHAYRINNQAYNSIQGYLWGESSTIAKALWQKFQNKTHNPTSCVVGCYSLPGEFMPSGSAASGVQLAGMLLTPISGTCQDVSQALNFVDKTYEFGKIDPPFGSWLDYSGVQVIIRIPFCGVIQAAAEYCIGKNITIRYRVDQLNGNLVCIVYADGRVIAETSGNCAYNVPVSGGDDGTLQRLGAAVTGILQITAGNYAGALSSAAEAAGAVHQTQLVNSDMHGSMTACENRVPYIEWIYPTTAYTKDYPNANGLPCEFSGTLDSFAGGYGEFEVMPASLNIPDATAAEKEEIASLLRGGVIV